jgi:predicted MFS family arabinose efflux permease
MFAALLAPSALSLLAATFTDPSQRGKAFGIFGAIAGAGGAFGLLLGGALTEFVDWRWCLYISIMFAVPAALGGVRLLHSIPSGARPRIDVPGTVAATAGLFSLVYGLAHAETDGWGDPTTVAFLVASAVLLAAFVVIELRVSDPLLPLRVVADRNRGASYLAIGMLFAGMFAVFLFLTFYLQRTKGMSALETGFAFMPMNVSIIATATIVNTRVLARTGPKPLVPTGMALAAVAMALLTGIGVDTGYASHVLPSLIIAGVGFDLIIAPSIATATLGVPRRDLGVASAMVNTSQQLGGSIGTALLSTLAATATTNFIAGHGRTPDALRQAAVEGYSTAFWWAAGIFALGAVVTGTLLRPGVQHVPAHGTAEPAVAH